jgi:ferredoxin
MMIGFQFQGFTDLTCLQHLAVASNRVKTQIILHPGPFFLTFHFIFKGKAMADVANKYAENVPGKFYVDDQCIDCDLCRETAPANFKRNDDGGHSYVYKQPETPEEEGLCKEAMEGCPVEAIGSDGA